jgi:hypothetical protein
MGLPAPARAARPGAGSGTGRLAPGTGLGAQAVQDDGQHPVAGLSRLAQAHLTVVHGVSSAFTLAAILDVLALLVVLTVMRDRRAATIARTAERDNPSRAVANG